VSGRNILVGYIHYLAAMIFNHSAALPSQNIERAGEATTCGYEWNCSIFMKFGHMIYSFVENLRP
jgi:hypothetical protein